MTRLIWGRIAVDTRRHLWTPVDEELGQSKLMLVVDELIVYGAAIDVLVPFQSWSGTTPAVIETFDA
jgi:hypothetical protein